jgi:dTDP-4-amino-4,6-dideoxygalactose transaminase
MINVTKTYLPDVNKYKGYIDKIYASNQLTNNGQLVQELEKRLKKHLGVKNIILVANGTLALDIAYKALNVTGEVITTPFSFVATTNSIVSNGLTPVFADIDPIDFNLDPNNIEPLITEQTSAIVPVHVFGNPCQIELIQAIADKNNLNVIYDACHAFGVNYTDKSSVSQSILNHGDISTMSFHATKLFHTIEGGAVITNDDELAKKIRLLINFGITGSGLIELAGINAKMNEFEAAMGLCVLDDMEDITSRRKAVYEKYQNELEGFVRFPKLNENSTQNYSYFPIIFKSEDELLKVQKALNEKDIFPRRYFYPSLDTLDYLSSNQVCINSQNIASRILCLPIYPQIEIENQNQIIIVLKQNLK